MPKHANSRILPYSAARIYTVVMDVEHYPNVLPFIRRVVILEQREGEVTAEVTVGVPPLVFSYRCRIIHRPHESIEIEGISGPFAHLRASWKFTEREDGNTRVDYALDSAFRSPLMEATAGKLFARQLDQSIAAFEAELRKS